MVRNVTDDDLALQSQYRWERERPERSFLTQPLPGGAVRTFTWGQSADQVRRMATYLKAQGWSPARGSRSCTAIAPGGCWPILPFGCPAM